MMKPIRRMVITGGAAVLAVTALAGWDTPGDTPYLELTGAGHGRGMSQVGAFDSARQGSVAERILEHYYPGATFGTVPTTTVGVRLMERDGEGLDVHADAGLRVAGRELESGQAAHMTALPGGGANVVVTVGCDGEVLWQAATRDPWIYPIDPKPARSAAEHLTLCDGPAYRGALGLAQEDGAARTVNRVDIEDYLLGVVPAEVQANWADKGANEALRAQAIAARSYALAEQRYPFAQTCDTSDCQVYPGTAKEDPRAATAIATTAGAVLLRDGRILRAEYSTAPDGGQPADISTFDVGPKPAELAVGKPPTDPRVTPADPGSPTDPRGTAALPGSTIDREYARIGGESSAIGAPLGPEMRLPQNGGTYRLFTNGVIIATPTLGAQIVDFTTLMRLVPDPAVPPSDATEPASPRGDTQSPSPAETPTGAAPPGLQPVTE
ncbi:SpoIID/LytB domain-containing protein [Nocardia sp. NPDC005366]|uniref:SpoIID/LytB domain-containing protein n=1 Tax=Nocardia sp. NPDC005366 TaxID=3156878 RepID=UPI0033A98D32